MPLLIENYIITSFVISFSSYVVNCSKPSEGFFYHALAAAAITQGVEGVIRRCRCDADPAMVQLIPLVMFDV